MKKTDSKIIWGILFVLFGFVLALRELNVIPFPLFFRGWWTLFIIIPCIVEIISGKPTKSSFIGLVIGILLLCYVNGLFKIRDLGALAFSAVCIIVGISFFFKDESGKIKHEIDEREKRAEKYRAKREEEARRAKAYSTASKSDEFYKDGFNKDEFVKDEFVNNVFTKEDELNKDINEFSKDLSNNVNEFNYDINDYSSDSSVSDNDIEKEKERYEEESYEEELTNNSESLNHINQYNYQNDESKKEDYQGSNHGRSNDYVTFFSGSTIKYVDEEFSRAKITSILGNVQLDLRNAIFYGDGVIEVNCILGGVDIYVPSNIRVVNQCTAIMAGVDTNIMAPRNNLNSFTLYIKGNCILGGVEIK